MLFVLVLVLLVAVVANVAGDAAPTRSDTGYIEGKGFQLTLTSIGGGHWLRADAAAAFERMRAAAAAVGVVLIVNSSFRTWAAQAALYAKWLAKVGNRAAAPGHSNHQSGVALDIDALDDSGAPNAALAWLTTHAADFGFRRTVSDEPWHWEFIPAA